MMRYLAATAVLVGTAYSHGNHEQTPIEGPLQGLWYNTLPGDGGTQVLNEALGLRVLELMIVGGLCFLWNQYFWSTPVLSLFGDRKCQV